MNLLALKLVLAVVISLCGMLMGRLIAQTHARRAQALLSFEHAMNLLENKMLFERLPLAEALRLSDSPLFHKTGERMRDGNCSASEAFSALDVDLDGLTKEDKSVFTAFFSGLGSGGVNEHRLLFQKGREALEPLKASARAKYKEVSKLYSTLGALMGLAIAILLL